MQASKNRLRQAPVVLKNRAINSLNGLQRQMGLAKLGQYIKSRGKPNAVFIWIPKNAGSSTYNLLSAHQCPKLKNPELARDYFPNTGIVTFGHMDFSELVAKNYVSDRFYRTSFKFAFSRDPYSRAVSLFSYLKRKRWLSDISFLEFCRHLAEADIPPIGLYNVKGLSQCNPQVRWLENIEMDYIGNMENYSASLEQVFSHLDLPLPSSIVRKNVSRRDTFESYYCEESRQIIEHFYLEDFKAFDYPVDLDIQPQDSREEA